MCARYIVRRVTNPAHDIACTMRARSVHEGPSGRSPENVQVLIRNWETEIELIFFKRRCLRGFIAQGSHADSDHRPQRPPTTTTHPPTATDNPPSATTAPHPDSRAWDRHRRLKKINSISVSQFLISTCTFFPSATPSATPSARGGGGGIFVRAIGWRQ